MRTVLFHRDFHGFRGGHLKVWHYFNHVRSAEGYAARICFSRETVWSESNPWRALRHEAVPQMDSIRPDIYFLAGMDWLALGDSVEENASVPVINLVQSVRHSDPGDRRYPFLKRKAIRICVSDEVAAAINETKQVNGPVFVIPNAVDVSDGPPPPQDSKRSTGLLIAAVNNPDWGRVIHERLEDAGCHSEVLTDFLPRPEFLMKVREARVTVFLPDRVEGFYLPALEGMALGTMVVCPDCVGNRSFCLPEINCFRPEYSLDAIVAAGQAAIELDETKASRMLAAARETVARHDLMREREAFLRILENVDGLW